MSIKRALLTTALLLSATVINIAAATLLVGVPPATVVGVLVLACVAGSLLVVAFLIALGAVSVE